MMRCKNAEEWMEHLREQGRLIEGQRAELRAVVARGTDISAPPFDAVPGRSRGNATPKLQQAAVSAVVLQKRLAALERDYERERSAAMRLLEKLRYSEGRALALYYLSGGAPEWSDVAFLMKYSTRQVLRFRKAGLKELDILIKREVEKKSTKKVVT